MAGLLPTMSSKQGSELTSVSRFIPLTSNSLISSKPVPCWSSKLVKATAASAIIFSIYRSQLRCLGSPWTNNMTRIFVRCSRTVDSDAPVEVQASALDVHRRHDENFCECKGAASLWGDLEHG